MRNLTEKLLILIKVIFLLLSLNIKLFAQTFEYSEDYLEAPLIFSHETTLEGISKIVPIGGDFSKYSKIELSKVKNDIIEPIVWLKDKVYDETGEIVELENILKSEDSPLSDPIFDQFKHLPMYIDNTIEQLASNPLIFCNQVSKQYNKNGVFFELNCTIPFGPRDVSTWRSVGTVVSPFAVAIPRIAAYIINRLPTSFDFATC